MLNHHASIAATLAAAIAMPGLATAQTGPGLPAAAAKQNSPANDAQAPRAQNAPVQNSQTRTQPMPVERTQNAQWQDGSQQNQGANEELLNYLAAKLMLANECQVKMGEMAAKKAETQEVKDLAETLKKEHKELNNRLAEVMPRLETVASLSKSGSNQERGQKGAYQARRPNIDEQNAAGRSSDQFLNGAAQQLLDITRNAAEENHRAVTEMLGEKQGKDFDRCFLATEIGAHQWMLAELKAIQGIDQQQFTSLVKETEQKVEGHLKKAKELAKKMEEDRGSDNS